MFCIHYFCSWNFLISFGRIVWLQRLWYSTFSASRPSTFESVSKHILCGCHIFNGWLRWFCAGYLAFTALHGDYDLCGAHRSTNTGESKNLYQSISFWILLVFSSYFQSALYNDNHRNNTWNRKWSKSINEIVWEYLFHWRWLIVVIHLIVLLLIRPWLYSIEKFIEA